jgi:SNF2 family DNA or RNA helicase
MPYRFLGADIVPVSKYEQFRRTYMITVDPNQRIWKPLPGTATLVRKLIADVGIGFKKDACLDLPGIVEISRTCSMDAEQKKADKQLIKELVTVVEDMCQQCSGSNFGYMDCNRGCGNAIMIDHALVLIGKRRQIASGFYIQTMVKLNSEGKEVNDSQVVKIGKNPKLKLLGDYLDEIPFDEKVIVWTHWVWTIKEIETYLKARKDGGVVVCYGDIDAFDAVERFKLTGIKYFLAMPSKAGVGLNIQFSSYQVWFSNHYSWIQYDQAIARQDRQGQKNKVTVCHLVCEGSADEDVLAVLKHKRELSISLGSGAVIWKQFLKK